MKIKIRKSDTLFSQYLRKKRGYKSDYSGRFYEDGKGLSVSHFHGRRHENVRFDEENCDILNFQEHQHFEENPAEYTHWKMKQLGQKRYDNLLLRAQLYKKRDDKLQEIILRELIKQLS